MASYYKEGSTWTVAFRLKGQRRQYLYGIKSEALAQKAKEKKALEEQLVKADLLTPTKPEAAKWKVEAQKPLEEQLASYERSITARGKSGRHAKQMAQQARELLRRAKIRRIDAIAPEPIQAAAKAMLDDPSLGVGEETVNHYLRAVRAFSAWLARTNRVEHDPLVRKLTFYKVKGKERHNRRALSEAEIDLLLRTTAGERRRAKMSGEDRVMLYRLALGTGYRLSALLSLTKASFLVSAKGFRPAVILAADFNKNRKPRSQPIRQDLAAKLRDWLASKPDKGKVFSASNRNRVSEAFKADMAAARAAWLKSLTPAQRKAREGSEFLAYEHDTGNGKVFADFHSLRHTGITLVVRHAGLKVGQDWADHSTPILTARYAHMDLTDEAKALDALPAADLGEPQKERKKASG